MITKAEDVVIKAFFARTLDHVLFFTNQGRVYSERAYNLPEGGRTAKGAHINNVLNLQSGEKVTAMIPVEDFEQSEYIVLLTRQGRIKRMALSEFSRVRPSGIIAITLVSDDKLARVKLTSGDQDIIIISREGKALRFHESAVRAMGRTAAGVMGIRLVGDDTVAGMAAVSAGEELLIVTANGWGKRVELEDIPLKGRYTQGVWVTDHTRLHETGPIVVARSVLPSDDVTFMTLNGVAMRTPVSDISVIGRATRGVRCVRLQEGDALVSAARVVEIKTKDGQEASETPETSPQKNVQPSEET
jgi:DNA gyrase subunit A